MFGSLQNLFMRYLDKPAAFPSSLDACPGESNSPHGVMNNPMALALVILASCPGFLGFGTPAHNALSFSLAAGGKVLPRALSALAARLSGVQDFLLLDTALATTSGSCIGFLNRIASE